MSERSPETETFAWSSKQFGEVSFSLDNDELVGACEASLLQSIEEEKLRLMLDTGCCSSHLVLPPRCTPRPFTVTILSRGWKRRRPRALPTRRMVTEMLDAVERELRVNVEETEFQVSFSVIDARRQSSNSQRK